MLLSIGHSLQQEGHMSGEHANVTATVAAIETAFSGRWGVWLSDTGWWWATRTHALTANELSAGCAPFIQADNPDELTERIRQQERIRPSGDQPAPSRWRHYRHHPQPARHHDTDPSPRHGRRRNFPVAR
jgi:hypothetical protein